jgi:hypothetical protein
MSISLSATDNCRKAGPQMPAQSNARIAAKSLAATATIAMIQAIETRGVFRHVLELLRVRESR